MKSIQPKVAFLFVALLAAGFAGVPRDDTALAAQKMKPEELVAKHLEAIGSAVAQPFRQQFRLQVAVLPAARVLRQDWRAGLTYAVELNQNNKDGDRINRIFQD